jgi:signal transduction histidine kinase/CheY-like chemotaxis protein
MQRKKHLSEFEAKELIVISAADLERMKTRILMVTLLAGILTIVYPVQIIIYWYIAVIIAEFWGLKTQRQVEHAAKQNNPITYKYRFYYFFVSWAESICFATLFVALSIQEGQIPHFIPYLILLCTSFYVATSSYRNAHLMFGHLVFYITALILVSTRDVIITYPNIENTIWAQFLISLLVAYFLIDSFLFFHKIHLERRSKSQELSVALKHAEKLTSQKSDLISAIGHELRTPLNSILGFSQVIKRTRLSEKQHQYIDLIEGAGKNLQLLLSNILDGETLEQGFFQLHPQETDVPALLNRTLKAFETDVAQKSIYLKLQLDENIPDKIHIDPTRLGQCLSNLLSNAIKATQSGGITVGAHIFKGAKPKLIITVTDTGIGIPMDQTRIIFEKFVQGESQTNMQSGTGLGLWLVRSITKAMNGSVSLVSTSPAGSQFMLAFELGSAGQKPQTDQPDLCGLRVLHIEDTLTNLMLVQAFLAEKGIIVTEAKTGRDALKLLSQNAYDAVLCDLQLPDINGNQLLETIRQLKNENAAIPVIALTAQPEKIENNKPVSGFCAILPKPIDQRLLISTLTQSLKIT